MALPRSMAKPAKTIKYKLRSYYFTIKEAPGTWTCILFDNLAGYMSFHFNSSQRKVSLFTDLALKKHKQCLQITQKGRNSRVQKKSGG